MSDAPLHTPYDGSVKPFTIGLRPLDLENWIEVDDKLDDYLAEKDRLFASVPQKVFAAEAETAEAQREVLDLFQEHLLRRFPQIYRRQGETILVAGRSVQASDDAPPLLTASRLVQEDLVLMRNGVNGWRLAAASLCFPSSWSLAEKFGRPLDDIHVPVPGFGPGTRTAGVIARIFDNLKAEQPVERLNWSLQADATRHLPMSSPARDERATARPPRFPPDGSGVFVRVERQTLRKLPVSDDILFTIRIHLDPLRTLADHPMRAALAASFAAQLEALDAAQLNYKGLAADREQLAAALRAVGCG